MIKRDMQKRLLELAKQYQVVTITGPRQSGKTTLCKMAFPKMAYASLEDLETRTFALEDPHGFLAQYTKGVILDEIQRAPDTPSYIQGIVDENAKSGPFILTGSQNFQLTTTISQSLAGRTALLKLLPFSISELSSFKKKYDQNELLFTGFYPRIYDRKLNPTEALSFYFETYVERDIRSLINVKDLVQFQNFTKLCAGRTGQLLNLSSLGNEVGITHSTAREWLTLLQASYIVFLLPPYYKNFNKRITKTPKLYFYDVGLAAFLLGIENAQQMQRDPLRGNLFENMVIAELMKTRFNNAAQANFYYFRDSNGNEVDLLLESPKGLIPIEIKAGQTINRAFFKGLDYFESVSKDTIADKVLIYGGSEKQKRTRYSVYPYDKCQRLMNF